ncbi:MAG: F0F1 ATP synthase subunit B [Dehalococcoidia bacterium]|nr:F0F1 ATP synthase subunit B [Dehalococcoidia bacterium]
MDQLGLNIPTLIAQLANFVVLLLLLRFFLWKPITRMLDERQHRIRESLETADRVREEAQASERAIQGQIEEARREGQKIVANSQQIASRIQEEGRQQAQVESEALLARARSEIQLERDDAIAGLRKEFADITVSAAEKIIGQSLDRSAHQRLIDEALAQSTLQETKS